MRRSILKRAMDWTMEDVFDKFKSFNNIPPYTLE